MTQHRNINAISPSRFPDRRTFFDGDGLAVVVHLIVLERLERECAAAARQVAARIHEQLGCRGVTRSDFIVVDGIPHFLELNTLPGLTANSLVPKAARVAGIEFWALLDQLVGGAAHAIPSGS